MKALIATLVLLTASSAMAQEVKVPPNPHAAVYKKAEYRKFSFYRLGVRRYDFLGAIPIFSPVIKKQEVIRRIHGPSLHLYYK